MTTIAIKDGIMACDSQVTAGSVRTLLKFQKVIRHEECFYGFAGDCHYISLVKEYIKGMIGIEDIPDAVSLVVLCLPKVGKPFEMTIRKGFVTALNIDIPYYSIGSGSEFATTAMLCGKTAKEAVEVAKVFDVYTGGSVKTYSFKSKKDA